jgi:hypothetical protein
MDQAELDRAIAQANWIFSRRYITKSNVTEVVNTSTVKLEVIPELEEARSDNPWPPESLQHEARFGQPHAKLFPYLGRKVRTPNGPGTLIQVFADRVTVLLDTELSRCSFFHPGKIEPVSCELEPPYLLWICQGSR